MTKELIVLKNFYNIKLIHSAGITGRDFEKNLPHSHSHFELFIHLKGHLNIFVESKMYKVTEHTIRLYNSGELHCGKAAPDEEAEWYQISIPRIFFETKPFKNLRTVFSDKAPGENNVFISRQAHRLETLMHDIFSAYKADSALSECIGIGNILEILCVLNNSTGNIYDCTLSKSSKIYEIIELINANCSSLNSLSDLCSLTHYSRSYLNSLFKDIMDISPYKFIVGKKLDNAKKALESGNSVTHACEYAGFGNYNNFITLFHKFFNVTPLQYKNSVCKK